ncbi:DUF6418 domain-containing protein [Sphingomonas sp. LY29]|uniref:DUF6418 domain-containing protein n=1 Tax=Sphingomonas sp. LY29 TaxID=3095341 RepID=UPI002D79AF84|nr:DUF6418 domain-containing protein [Sphingomonas sp. LY29]WRP26342.1 DUF6418 domain-containing protein [Sphingomonas sp. LY29]
MSLSRAKPEAHVRHRQLSGRSYGVASQGRELAMTRAQPAYKLFAIYLFISLVAGLETFSPAWVWPVVSLAAFAAFLLTMSRHYREAIFTLFAIEIAKILMLISLAFIGAGFFVRELGIIAEASTHSAYYALTACLYIHAACLTFKAARHARGHIALLPAQQSLLGLYVLGAGGLCIFAVLYLIVLGLTDGFPMLAGVDRFSYRADQGWLFRVIITFKPILAGLMGMIRFRFRPRPWQRWLLDFTFGLLIGAVVLFGEKFLSLLVMGGAYLLPFLLRRKRRSPSSLLIATGLSMAVLVSSATVYVYSDYGTLGASETSERLLGRFTGQGQLWYAASNASNREPNFDQLRQMGNVMMSSEADEEAFRQQVGIFHLISRFAPSNIYDSIMAGRGLVQFTGGFEAYFLIVGGHLVMIAAVIFFGGIAGLVAFYVYESLIAGAVVGYVGAWFIYMAVYSASNQASVWQVIGWKSLLYFAIVIGMDRIARSILSVPRSPKTNLASFRELPRR